MKTSSRFLLAMGLVAVIGCDKESADADKPAGEDSPATGSASAKQLEPVDISSAKAPPDTWMEFAATDYGFEARFPVAPKKDDMSVPTVAGTIPGAMWMAEQGNEAVGLTVMTVPESMLGEFNVEAALDGGRDGMINNVGGTIVSENQTDFAGQKARAVVAKVPNPDGGEFQLEARLFWVSPRVYQLLALTPAGSNGATAQKYFDSFKLTSG